MDKRIWEVRDSSHGHSTIEWNAEPKVAIADFNKLLANTTSTSESALAAKTRENKGALSKGLLPGATPKTNERLLLQASVQVGDKL